MSYQNYLLCELFVVYLMYDVIVIVSCDLRVSFCVFY